MRPYLRIAILCVLLTAFLAPAVHAETFFVRFNDGGDKLADEQWLKDNGIRVVRKFQLTEAILCETMNKSAAPLKALAADSRVLYTAPNVVYDLAVVPDDPSFPGQWALQNTGQTGGTPGADINALAAWDMAGAPAEVLVAIMDTGIDYNHPDLVNRLWDGGTEYPNHGYDFGANDNDPMPQNTHGTHVAGTVGAEIDNGLGVAGIAPNARLIAVKASRDSDDRFPTDAVIAAMDFCAAQGVDVINASFGSLSSGYQPVQEALENLHAAGTVFVAAAGNDYTDLDQSSQLFYPACYEVPNVISVAATTDEDLVAGFSNTGSQHVDLAAPGEGILSTLMNEGYGNSSGTSMAAPHVTGAVALLLGVHPDLTPEEVRAIVMDGSHPLPNLSRAVITGGRLDLVGMLAAADDVAPGAVTDLAVGSAYGNLIRLAWTAVGNDGYSGTASVNDLRYALTPILGEADFAAATRVNDVSTPPASGFTDGLGVTGLEPDTVYYFALKVGDEAGNWSPMATVSGATTELAVAVIDDTPRSYSLFTGQKVGDAILIESTGTGTLSYLVQSVSVGAGKSMSSRLEPVGPTVPHETDRPERASGRHLRAPQGATGLHDLVAFGTEKSADWGTIFFDDFATDDGFWTPTVASGTDYWHYTNAAYNSPQQGMAFVDAASGSYDAGAAQDVSLVSGSIDLTYAEGGVTLEFFEWYETELGYDFCDVEASSDGSNWVPVRTEASGSSGGWRLTQADLTGFAGDVVQLRFRLHTGDDVYNDYPGWYIDDVKVTDGGPGWLFFVYGSGHVTAGQARNASYQVNGEGLCAGTYNAEVRIHTNDPTHALVTVPIDVTVSSAADLHYASQGIDLGPAYVGFPETTEVLLENRGCSVLDLSGLASSSPEIVATLSATSLAPGTTAVLSLAFSPTSTGNRYAFVTFQTNDPDESAVTLVAFGSGELPPEVVLPETAYTMQVSGETVWHRNLEIRNDGDGPLDWQFVNALDAAGAPVVSPRVLWDIDYDLRTLLKGNLIEAGYQITSIADVAPDGLTFTSEILADFDVLVLHGGRAMVASEIDAIGAWTLAGGGLFFDHRYCSGGNLNPSSVLTALGSTMYIEDYQMPNVTLVDMPQHALTEGVDEVFSSAARGLYGLNAPFQPLLKTPDGQDLAAFGVCGEGRVVVTTGNFTWNRNLNNVDNAVFVDNIMEWVSARPVAMEPAAGILAPGTSQIVAVQYDSNDIAEGTHEYTFHVASNDPATPVVSVDATYVLDGIGHIYLAQNEYSMGLVFAAGDTTMAIELWNKGNGAVFIQGSTSSNDRFLIKPAQLMLQPWERKDLNVRFLPGDEGGEVTEIALAANSPGQDDLRFLVDANPQLPHSVVSTDDLGNVTLYTGASTSQPFTVTNNGLWPLEYSFSQTGAEGFIAVSSQAVEGTVAAGESMEIGVGYYPGLDCGTGTVATVLSMASNDQTPPEEIATSLTVVDAQHITVYHNHNMAHYVGLPRGVTQTVTINNPGCLDLEVTNITVQGEYFSVPNIFTGTVAPGASAIFRVTFNPLEEGIFYGSVSIFSDDPDDPVHTIGITGEGVEFGEPAKDLPVVVDKTLRNAPNPFNPSTTISFYAPHDGSADVRIFNLRGQLVRQLDAGTMTVGRGSVDWNGRDRRGNSVASGVYFYQLYLNGQRTGDTGRAMLLK